MFRHKSSIVLSQNTTGNSVSYLLAWPAPETVGVELVSVEDVDGTFDTQVVQLTGHL